MAQAGRGHKDIEMPQQYQMSQSIEEAGFRAISVVSDVLTGVSIFVLSGDYGYFFS